MGTFILLVFMSLIGGAIGHFAFAHLVIGALIGFVVGVLIRIGGGGSLDDCVDIFD